MKPLIILIAVCVLSSCTNETEAKRVLEMDGVTNISMTGYKWFSCSKGDFYHTGFVGLRNDKPIEGVVCSGLIFKSSTVRY